ncbi:sulfotransferase family 2 domain-containing protein [Luteimonas aquatica]|uniref:sulfotransferase family 2 domain-containing protein n=1 Tax=Luteimonas aquatica TaxID=450364 RepID=UPI001F57C2C7|nr:sulfotransferase family 2 domain-containing protein [Luteimonas aquatica]
MLINDDLRFLFVHVQKTGGTSISRFLKEKVAGTRDYLRPHDPYLLAARDHGAGHRGYFKAAFVRNPFDRLVSWYASITSKARLLSEEEKLQNPDYNRVQQHVLAHAPTFGDFVTRCQDATDRSGWKPFLYNQIDYLLDGNGAEAMDFVGRFEHLQRDFRNLCSCLGLDGAELPHLNASTHRDYRDYYTPSTRRVVEERFAKDCLAFDYRF